MSYRVRVYPIGRRLGPVSESSVYDAETETEAIRIGMEQLHSVPRDVDPLVFEIFDPDDRLILSYTSEVRPRSGEVGTGSSRDPSQRGLGSGPIPAAIESALHPARP